MSAATGHTSNERLFIHSRRPTWGVGLLVNDQDKRRSLQFQDGRTRTFAVGFYHLLEPWTGTTPARTAEVARNLETAHAQIEAHLSQSDSNDNDISFRDQIRLFRSRFPDGFGGQAWLDACRRPVESRKAKRHVDIAVEVAAEALAEPAMRALLDAKDWSGMLGALASVLKKTSIASPSKDVKPLEEIPEASTETVARALFELLHGEGEYRDRVSAWVVTLGRAEVPARWELAALPGALLRPTEHPLVLAGTLSLQARILRTADAILMPSVAAWDSAMATLDSCRERLAQEGEAPADLLDISLFARETLRASSLTAIRSGEF